jgi:hypothetical protein
MDGPAHLTPDASGNPLEPNVSMVISIWPRLEREAFAAIRYAALRSIRSRPYSRSALRRLCARQRKRILPTDESPPFA